MSTDVQLPDAEQAVATLDSIYVERFFDKMAGLGFQPNSDEEAMAMLQTAVQLDALPEKQANQQQVDQQQSPYVLANQKLAEFLQTSGVDTGLQDLQKQSADNERAELAVALASNADLYKSALSVQQARADVQGSQEQN